MQEDFPMVSIEPSNLVGQDEEETRRWLLSLGILVDRLYNVIVCLECGGIALYNEIISHKRDSHFSNSVVTLPETRLPSPERILAAISSLGGDTPKPPNPADGPIAPIPGVEIQREGRRCTLTGCSKRVFPDQRRLREHQLAEHPTVPVSKRTKEIVLCQALSLYCKESRIFIEVLEPEVIVSDEFVQFKEAAERVGLFAPDELYVKAEHESEKGPVLSQTRWDELLIGVEFRTLRRTAHFEFLSKQDDFTLLYPAVKRYFADIVPKISRLPVLTRRYVLDPLAALVFFKNMNLYIELIAIEVFRIISLFELLKMLRQSLVIPFKQPTFSLS